MRLGLIRHCIVIATVLGLALAGRAGATDLVVSVQPDFSSGKYGTGTTTNLLETSLSIKIKERGYGFGFKLPYLVETGTQPVLPGVGPIGPNQASSFRHDGGGNTRLSGWVTVWHDDDAGLRLDAVAKVTPPGIGRWQALSVGFTRADLELAAVYALTPRTDIEVDFGRRFFIGAPGLDLTNYWYSTISLTHELSDKWTIGVSADIQTRSSSGGTPVLEIGPFVEYEISDGWRVGANVYRGFTRDSADFGGGLSVTRRFRF